MPNTLFSAEAASLSQESVVSEGIVTQQEYDSIYQTVLAKDFSGYAPHIAFFLIDGQWEPAFISPQGRTIYYKGGAAYSNRWEFLNEVKENLDPNKPILRKRA